MAFVGRVRALSRMLGAVEEASAGRARLVLVAGEAGIGKTSLISEVAARAGLRVGWGTCADAERAPAFWPWTAALRGLLATLGTAEVEALTRTDIVELSRLLPELTGPGTPGGEARAGREPTRCRRGTTAPVRRPRPVPRTARPAFAYAGGA